MKPNDLSFDPQVYRKDFPLLAEKAYDKTLVYFDNAATTQKPLCVLNKITEVYTTQNANIHRGVHYLSQKATMAHENARQTVADFLGARSAKEIVLVYEKPENVRL